MLDDQMTSDLPRTFSFDGSTAPTNVTVVPKVNHSAMSVKHQSLLQLDLQSIRVFRRKYDAYCKEVTASAPQFSVSVSASLELGSPVSIISYVDSEQLGYAVKWDMIDVSKDVENLTSVD